MNIYSVNPLPKEVLLLTAKQHKILRKKNGYSQKELAERAVNLK
jgi:DNA-binding XRE family transcriptional regulator